LPVLIQGDAVMFGAENFCRVLDAAPRPQQVGSVAVLPHRASGFPFDHCPSRLMAVSWISLGSSRSGPRRDTRLAGLTRRLGVGCRDPFGAGASPSVTARHGLVVVCKVTVASL